MPYKLTYFPCRGRAMHIRYLLTDNNLEFEDIHVTGETWPALKPKTAFGQIPRFEDGSFEVVQSNAILRYLARKHGLYGSNDQEKALIDMINDQQEDARIGYLRLIWKEWDTEKAEYIKGVPDKMAVFEKTLTRNKKGDGFFVGDKISFVDYTVFDLLDIHAVLSPGCLDAYPKLKAFHSRIAARPKIAAYRATEAFKNLPINGNGLQ